MALPAWPAGLPPLVGLEASLGTAQLYQPPQVTPMDDGPGRSRQRTLTDETPRTIVLILTRAQFVAFKTFVKTTLNKGARRFTAPVRLPDGTLGTRTVRISTVPSEQDLGPNSRVSFTLTVYDW